MNKTQEALRLALEALEGFEPNTFIGSDAELLCHAAITAIREALAEQPAIKPWVELTAMEIEELGKPYQEKDKSIQAWGLFACAVDEKLKEKNT